MDEDLHQLREKVDRLEGLFQELKKSYEQFLSSFLQIIENARER